MKKLVMALCGVAVIMCVGYYGQLTQPTAVKIGTHVLTIPTTSIRLQTAGYTLASNSNYVNDNGEVLVAIEEDSKIVSIEADTKYSSTSDMTVYGGIKLGDPEERVRLAYGEPILDLINGLLFKKSVGDENENVYVATLDGTVIHIEVRHEEDTE